MSGNDFLKASAIVMLWLSYLGICIYAGYTFGNNIPERDSSILYILSCIKILLITV